MSDIELGRVFISLLAQGAYDSVLVMCESAFRDGRACNVTKLVWAETTRLKHAAKPRCQ